ncbi:MAG TPA: FAD:protein FMN transferase [Bacillales bacterium]|nr:FAD:protein FMN transferase [Bacillales bacterium]
MIEEPKDRNLLETLSFEAMNTTFYFALTNCKIPNWKEVIQEWVRYVEKEWSRFSSDNELARINQLPINQEMLVSPPLFDVFQTAEHYRQRTNGFFSPYLLRQMQYHGYDESFPFYSKNLEMKHIPNIYDKDTPPFSFDHKTTSIKRLTEGQIDLGGIAKGYTVEAAARWLKNEGGARAGMADGGGDLTVWSDEDRQWNIGIAHPYQKDVEIAQFRLKNGSVATSNVIYRSWTQGKKLKHHILNGRTGQPTESSIIQATVISDNCLDAEVGAKLCFIEQEMNIKNELKNLNPACSFLLVNKNGEIMDGCLEESK